MQQAQVNLLADMGAQPATLMTGLVAATQVDRHHRPDRDHHLARRGRERRQRRGGHRRPARRPTPAASGGRRRGLHRRRHHLAPGHGHHRRGPTPTSSRASARASDPGARRRRQRQHRRRRRPAAVTVTVPVLASSAPTVPADPGSPTTAAPSSSACGSRRSVDGFVTGVRFYKGTGNTGTHVGSLWSSTGTRLATVTFTNETATGWQTASFGQPVAGHGRADLRRLLHRPAAAATPCRTVGLQLRRGPTPRRCTVAGGFGRAPAGVFGDAGHVPAESYQQRQLLRRRRCSRPPTTPRSIGDEPVAAGRLDAASRGHTTVSGHASPRPCRRARPVADASRRRRAHRSPGTTVVRRGDAHDHLHPVARRWRRLVLHRDARRARTRGAARRRGRRPGRSRTAKPPSPPGVCPCSLFDDETTPTIARGQRHRRCHARGRGSPPTSTGTVTGVRFYKGAGQHRRPHRHPVDRERHAAGHRAPSPTSRPRGWQTADLHHAGHDQRRTPSTSRPTAPRRAATPPTPGRLLVGATCRGRRCRCRSTAGAYTYGDRLPGRPSSTQLHGRRGLREGAGDHLRSTSQAPAPGALDVPRTSPVVVEFSDRDQATGCR